MIKILMEDVVRHHNTEDSIESYSNVSLLKINDVIYFNLQYRVYGEFGSILISKYSKDEMFLIKDINVLKNILEEFSNHIADKDEIITTFSENIK